MMHAVAALAVLVVMALALLRALLGPSLYDRILSINSFGTATVLLQRELVVGQGRVVGVIVEREGERLRVDASRGVVLACGGFPHDVERRKALFPHAPTGREHYTPSPESNTGDGLKLAEAVGGWVDRAKGWFD